MARILIVDDDPILRAVAVEILTQAGHVCAEAGDGELAVEWLERNRADLVVTDMFMPRKDGLEVLREIKAHWPAIKVIGISAGWNDFKAADILRMAGLMGADAVTGKPLDAAKFSALVEEVLGRA
jgi:CheY-like chemotaxis protein